MVEPAEDLELPPNRVTAPVNIKGFYPFAHGLPNYPFFSAPAPSVNPISKLDRIPPQKLRLFGSTVPGFSAIQRITNGVLAMQWQVETPLHLRQNDSAIWLAQQAESSIRKPNASLTHDTYRKFISAIVDDLLTINYAIVERQPGESPERPFWLWVGNAGKIKPNPQWNERLDGVIPKFIDFGFGGEGVGIMSENAFMLQLNVNSYEIMPPSPLEVAYRLIETWLGLSDYQKFTTSSATQEYLLDLGDINETELNAFREYWDLEVVQGKKMAMVGAGGKMKSVKIGATGDEGLYPLYTEYLLKLIALAFSLSSRDSNVGSDDNFATADVSASSTFYYAIKPVAQAIDEGLDGEAIGYYLPGFRFTRSYKAPRQESELNKESREDWIAGITSRNEARAERGLEAMEGGNQFSSQGSGGSPV